MPFCRLPAPMASCFQRLATALDVRSAVRLPVLLVGLPLAKGRRACTAWFRAAGITDDFRRAYNVVGACGRRVEPLAVRLPKNAALRDLPAAQPSSKRGPKPTYGKNKVVLKLRAGHLRGWEEVTCWQYGRRVAKLVKTLLATWEPAGGVIRGVLVQEGQDDNWRAYSCTKPEATAQEILGTAARRTATDIPRPHPTSSESGGYRPVAYHSDRGAA
jgi:hypothetical protein